MSDPYASTRLGQKIDRARLSIKILGPCYFQNSFQSSKGCTSPGVVAHTTTPSENRAERHSWMTGVGALEAIQKFQHDRYLQQLIESPQEKYISSFIVNKNLKKY